VPGRPAGPHRAVGLDGGNDGIGPGVARGEVARRVVEADEHLVEHDVVEDADAEPRRAVEASRELAGTVAGAGHQLGDAAPPQRADRGPDGEAPGAARRLGHPVVRIALAAGRLHVVRRAERHRRVVGVRVRAEREPRVVRDVEPLVAVGRPRVGPVDATEQVPAGGVGRRPQAEGPVDMEPAAVRPDEVGDLDDRVEGARVDVARLRADERGPVDARQDLRQCIGAHAPLVVGRHTGHAVAPEAEHLERDVDRDVGLLAHHDRHIRCAEQAVALDIPAGALEQRVASRRERRERGHGRPGGEPCGHAGGQPEEFRGPLGGRLLGHRRGWAQDVQPRVLVPGRGQPVGGQRSRQAPADHEAEVAWPGGRNDARVGVARQCGHRVGGVLALLRQRAEEPGAELVQRDVRRHRAVVHAGQPLAGERLRPVEGGVGGGARSLVVHPRMIAQWSKSRRDALFPPLSNAPGACPAGGAVESWMEVPILAAGGLALTRSAAALDVP
jgi:hypothetical protein